MTSRTVAEHEARLAQFRARVQEIDTASRNRPFTAEQRREWDDTNEAVEAEVAIVHELRARENRLKDLAGDSDHLEAGTFGVRTTPINADGVALTRDQSVAAWARSRHLPGCESENHDLSFDRYVRGLVSGNWEGSDTEKRAVSEIPSTAGGHMVPTPLALDVIDKARNASRVFEAGATTVPMTSGTLKYARLVTEAVPAWRNEAAAVTDQAMVFDSVTLTAQSLAVMVKISVELFEDAPPADGVIANSFARQIALELDRVALRGTGTTPEPRGVLNQTGVTVTTHGVNGSVIGSPPAAGTLGWEALAQSVGVVRANNFEPTAQVMNPRTDQSLGLLRDTTNQYIAPPKYLDSVPRLVTKQVPSTLTVGTSTDTSEVYTADWRQLLVGIRTGFNIRFLQERFVDNLQYAFLAYLRADVQIAQPTAFVVDTGVRG